MSRNQGPEATGCGRGSNAQLTFSGVIHVTLGILTFTGSVVFQHCIQERDREFLPTCMCMLNPLRSACGAAGGLFCPPFWSFTFISKAC